jgi:hypothetical protein
VHILEKIVQLNDDERMEFASISGFAALDVGTRT